MPRPFALVLFLALAALIAAGCGEDEQASADASDLLATAFETPLESGRMSLTADVQVDGVPFLGDGIDVRLEGPFTGREAQLDASIGGLGPGLGGGFVLTEDNVFLTFAGRSYELGEDVVEQLKDKFKSETGKDAGSASLSDLGIDLETWLRDPRVDGEDEVGAEPVTKVVAGIDASAVLSDLAPLARAPEAELERLSGFLEEGRADVYISREDQTVRRVTLDVEFAVPEDARGDLAGAEGGAARIDVTFTEVGEPQEIEVPTDARPLGDLLEGLGLGMELFRQ